MNEDSMYTAARNYAEARNAAGSLEEDEAWRAFVAGARYAESECNKSGNSDTARLEWIARTGINEAGFEWWEGGDLKTHCCISVYHHQSNTTTERRYSGKDFRSMIDAAMADENKPGGGTP